MRNGRHHAHAQVHAMTRSRERRQQVAHEAARLMAEGGLGDYHQARRKAAQRLGITNEASLPTDREIEEALREYQRLFLAADQAGALRLRREAAARALAFFREFQPRLVGPVLDGTADTHSPIALHLHSDDLDAVPRWLDEHGVPATARSRRLRLDRERDGEFPVWQFLAEDLAFEVTVLPLDVVRQAPLSGIDGKPMARASLARLQALLLEGTTAADASPLPRP